MAVCRWLEIGRSSRGVGERVKRREVEREWRGGGGGESKRQRQRREKESERFGKERKRVGRESEVWER